MPNVPLPCPAFFPVAHLSLTLPATLCAAQATCESKFVNGVDGTKCTWGASGGGTHCAGAAGCETNTAKNACDSDSKNCNWNKCAGDAGCETNNDQTSCQNDSKNCNWKEA